MELITENRHRLIQALINIKPSKIISFSPVNLEALKDRTMMVIMNTQQYKNNPFDIPEKWEVRLNNKIHAKIAIGINGFIIGSWNFSDNSTFTMHESVLKVDYETAPKLQQELASFFEKLWERSSPV